MFVQASVCAFSLFIDGPLRSFEKLKLLVPYRINVVNNLYCNQYNDFVLTIIH